MVHGVRGEGACEGDLRAGASSDGRSLYRDVKLHLYFRASRKRDAIKVDQRLDGGWLARLRRDLPEEFTMKSKAVAQSTLLTSTPNHLTRALPPRGSREPLRLAEGGALPCEVARHCPGF